MVNKKTKLLTIISLLAFVFLFSSFATAISACTPDSGYKYCYQSSYSYGDAQSKSQVQLSDIQGKYKSGYYVGEAYFNIKFIGKTFYEYDNLKNWNYVSCSESGCTSGTNINSGKISLASPGQEFNKCIAFVSWDKTTAKNGDWAWSWSGYGWTTDSGCLNIKSVSCYDDLDCGSGTYCDKSGAWNTWNCKIKECDNGQNQTRSDGFYLCENYKYVKKGVCSPGTSTCDGNLAKTCGSNYAYATGIATIGKCNVQCKVASDCGVNNLSANTCTADNKVSITNTTFSCTNYVCSNSVTPIIKEACPYGCDNGACLNPPATDYKPLYYGIGIAVAIVAILLIILWLLFKKPKRK